MNSASSEIYEARGGARIGYLGASSPLAHLEATRERLGLTVSMFGLFELGSYSFKPAEVVSLEPFSTFLNLVSGVRILHTRADYPQNLIFWANPGTTLAGIAATGFAASAPASEAAVASSPRGFPLRWGPLVLLVLAWNGLFSIDVLPALASDRFPLPGPFVLTALLLFFGVSLGMVYWNPLQSFFLKPGRYVGEIRPLLLLIGFITGFQVIAVSILVLAGPLKIPLKGKPARTPAQEALK